MNRFLAAMRFLTILPVPGKLGTAEGHLAGSVAYFPMVGLVLGGLAAAVVWAMTRIPVPPMLASAVVVVVLLTFSGALHMDGLSDTADGFLSSRSRERIMEIMKDSRVGAMGVVAIVCVLLVKFAALASMGPGRLWAAALLMPLCGRCTMVVQMALLPYARTRGLGNVFYRRGHRLSAVWAVVIMSAAGWMAAGAAGIAAAEGCVLAGILFARYCHKKIGGATGDTFGAACEIAELAAALVLACWPMRIAG